MIHIFHGYKAIGDIRTFLFFKKSLTFSTFLAKNSYSTMFAHEYRTLNIHHYYGLSIKNPPGNDDPYLSWILGG